MTRRLLWIVAALCCLLLVGFVAPLAAQTAEVKEKPPIYAYVGEWAIPRAQWAEMEKSEAADQAMLQSAMAAGTIVGYGFDTNLVHQPDGPTHDDFWVATSMALY